jgi:hypothetical protein
MGLETAHPEVLGKLNKGMTLDQFRAAAANLRTHGVAVRAFLLVGLPFLDEADSVDWAKRSVDFALEAGVEVCCFIPTRGGNGALEALTKQGLFASPHLAALEAATEYGVGLERGRVFADLWDLEAFSDCPDCFEPRAERLRWINLKQSIPDPVSCESCRTRLLAGRQRLG